MRGSKRILVVDDNEAIRQIFKIVLEAENYTIELAKNGSEALNQLERGPLPGLIFLDLMMPVMDGWEFAARFQENAAWAKIPIVVVSSFSQKTKPVPGATMVLPDASNLDSILQAARDYTVD